MAKRLTPIDLFYIEHNKSHKTVAQLAALIGCTERTVYNYLRRSDGEARTEAGREQLKTDVAPAPEAPPKPELDKRVGGARMLEAASTKHGTGGAVVMTKPLSEISDETGKQGVDHIPLEHLHFFNKDK